MHTASLSCLKPALQQGLRTYARFYLHTKWCTLTW